MFSVRKSHDQRFGERTRLRVRFETPSRRTLFFQMPCGIQVERLPLKSNPLKFLLSGCFKVIQGVSTCFKGFSARIFFIGFLALKNPRSSADNSNPKSTLSPVCERLIRVENKLVPTCHRPKNRPENKGIKPITNRHKPKNFSHALIDSDCDVPHFPILDAPRSPFKPVENHR